jgi:hypothetical protein
MEALAESQLAELRGRVAEHPLHRRVDLDVASVDIRPRDPDRSAVEDRPEAGERGELLALGLEFGRMTQRRRNDGGRSSSVVRSSTVNASRRSERI